VLNCAYQTLILLLINFDVTHNNDNKQVKIFMLNSVLVMFKNVLYLHIELNATKVIFVTFNLNTGLHTVFVRKPFARMFGFGSDFLCPNLNRISVFHTPCYSQYCAETSG